jgi:hypothetical protein
MNAGEIPRFARDDSCAGASQSKHFLTGIYAIDLNSRICSEQLGQESAIPLAHYKRTFAVDRLGNKCGPGALQGIGKDDPFQKPIA